tara:strand:+ start:2020 stop:3021 length:1002 start_codon:yes stop_codon:yes gene_type:complete
MKKILITGAEGFIGSHLVEKLVLKGFKVKCLVYYNSFSNLGWLDELKPSVLKKVEIVVGDVRDSDLIKNIIKDCDVIYNLAALIGIPYSYTATKSYIDTNIVGLLNILNACKYLKIKKIIHTSTSEVYGSAVSIPMKETHPLSAQSPYAASKIGADQLALSFFKSFNLPITILRPFNTFGPRQSLRAVIPTIISQALNSKQKKIKIGNIKSTRDFNYISDTVDAFVLAMNAKKTNGEVINIGSGKETNIKEVLQIVINLIGVKKKILIEKRRLRPKKSEVDRLCACNKKARLLLKWKPKRHSKTEFIKSLKKTIDWFKNYQKKKNFRPEIYHT